jgi:hypothetical protein
MTEQKKYDNDNEIALWVNDRKDSDRHPDLKGNAKVNGVEYWASAWKRKEDANERAPFVKISLTAKDAPKDTASYTNTAPTEDVVKKTNDEIPF